MSYNVLVLVHVLSGFIRSRDEKKTSKAHLNSERKLYHVHQTAQIQEKVQVKDDEVSLGAKKEE